MDSTTAVEPETHRHRAWEREINNSFNLSEFDYDGAGHKNDHQVISFDVPCAVSILSVLNVRKKIVGKFYLKPCVVSIV